MRPDNPGRRSLLVGAAALLPAGAASAQSERDFTVGAMMPLRIFQAMIETLMGAMLRSLDVLAADASLALNWASFAPGLRAVAKLTPSQPVAWLALPNGGYTTTFDGAQAPDNLTAQPFFTDLMQGRSVAGEALISRVSGQRVVMAAQPILRNGRVVGAVGVELSARAVMDAFYRFYELPREFGLMALNDAALIVLHTERNRIFQSPNMTEPSIAAAVHRVIAERSGQVSYREGPIRRVAVFNKSDALGLHFVLYQTL